MMVLPPGRSLATSSKASPSRRRPSGHRAVLEAFPPGSPERGVGNPRRAARRAGRSKLVTMPASTLATRTRSGRKVEDNSEATVMIIEEHYDLAAEDEKDDTVRTVEPLWFWEGVTTSGSTCITSWRTAARSRSSDAIRYGNSEKEVTNLRVLLPITLGAGSSPA